MVGWHQRLDGHEFERTQGDREGQGSLVRDNPRGRGVKHDDGTATNAESLRLCTWVCVAVASRPSFPTSLTLDFAPGGCAHT